MAHWAELDKNNKVLRVTVGDNNDTNGDEGYSWLIENLGGRWLKTSYNASIRKHFAGVGFTYDDGLDAFIPPKPFESWLLDEETCQWQAPVPYPKDDLAYYWDESSTNWELADFFEPNAESES
jgi:hypothetical protein